MADAPTPSPAVLSALAAQVDELLTRVATGGEAAASGDAEGLAAALFDAERALRSAGRALERASRAAG